MRLSTGSLICAARDKCLRVRFWSARTFLISQFMQEGYERKRKYGRGKRNFFLLEGTDRHSSGYIWLDLIQPKLVSSTDETEQARPDSAETAESATTADKTEKPSTENPKTEPVAVRLTTSTVSRKKLAHSVKLQFDPLL